MVEFDEGPGGLCFVIDVIAIERELPGERFDRLRGTFFTKPAKLVALELFLWLPVV
jgi:hypothetical protein